MGPRTGRTMSERRKKAPPIGAGDSHNFGHRVTIEGNLVHKPRTLLWEWLTIGEGSPLRALLCTLAKDEGHEGAFAFLPELRFSSPSAREGGRVERLDLAPLGELSRDEKRALATVVGRSLALWSWLGVSDLHWENLALGRARDGHVVFGPLDVEIVFDDFAFPTATKLLPEACPEYGAMNRHAAGLRRVLPFLGKPLEVGDLVATVGAYAATLALLDRHRTRIAETILAVPQLRDAPIRVLLRGTGEYVESRTKRVWPPLLDAEAEQLARGDIPYFFRLYGRPGIHYFVEPTLERLGRLPLRGDVPQLAALLSLEKGLRSKLHRKLGEEGLFTVVGAFDHPSFAGTHTVGDFGITFGARAVTLHTADGELETRRDMRAFVGSVYQRCRCGEVKTALVPATTVCTPTP